MVGIFKLVKNFKASSQCENRFKKLQERALLHPENLFIQVRLADLLAKLKKKNDAVGIYERVAQQFIQKNHYAHAIALKKIIFRLEPPKDPGEGTIVLRRLYDQMLRFRESTSIAEEPSPLQLSHVPSQPPEKGIGVFRLEPKSASPSAS